MLAFVQKPEPKECNTAIEAIEIVAQDKKATFNIRYSHTKKLWTLNAGFIKSVNKDFTEAARDLLRQIYKSELTSFQKIDNNI